MASIGESEQQPNLNRHLRVTVLWSVALAAFWVTFLWGFWKHDVNALGLNAFVYLAATVALFVWTWRRERIGVRENLFWLAPIGLIILSFLVYDNSFLKAVDILVLPTAFALFYNYSFLSDKTGVHWHSRFVSRLVFRCLSCLTAIGQSMSLHGRLGTATPGGRNTARRVVTGVLLFLVIALTVIIPLLSSADAAFAGYVGSLLKWFQDLVSETIVYKVFVAVALSVLVVAMALAWGKPFTFTEKNDDGARVDSIIAGIILGGTLAVYVFFLLVQLQQLWVNRLPVDFHDTEQLVKGGFWQLLFLTAINAAIYFFTYRKTAPVVQKILAAFMGGSLLLLFSAARRIALYVIYYGFSYEKFYAAYAVLFCAVLFVYLISRLFVRQRADIVRFLLVLFIWMYGIVSVFPVEQFVLRSNVALLRLENSRIRLFELTMLGPDVLGTVERYREEGKLTEKNPRYDREQVAPERQTLDFDWQPWMETQRRKIADKAWYEKNLMNWLYEIGR